MRQNRSTNNLNFLFTKSATKHSKNALMGFVMKHLSINGYFIRTYVSNWGVKHFKK